MILKKIAGFFVAVPALILGSVGVASAAGIPAVATTAFQTLETDVVALVNLAWGAAVPITVAFIVLKLFKKAAGSAV